MNKRPTSRAKKAGIRRQLEAEASRELDKAARDAMVYGTGILKDGKRVPPGDVFIRTGERKDESKSELLKDALRNVSRTATRRLDEAGVPDALQGGHSDEDDFDWSIWDEHKAGW